MSGTGTTIPEFLNNLPILDICIIVSLLIALVVGVINGAIRKACRLGFIAVVFVILYFTLIPFLANWIEYYSFSTFNYVLSFTYQEVTFKVYSIHDLFILIQNLNISSDILLSYCKALTKSVAVLVCIPIVLFLSTPFTWIIFDCGIKRALVKKIKKEKGIVDEKDNKKEKKNKNDKTVNVYVVNTAPNSNVSPDEAKKAVENNKKDKDDKKKKIKYKPKWYSRLIGGLLGVVEWLLIAYIYTQPLGILTSGLNEVLIPSLVEGQDLYIVLINSFGMDTSSVNLIHDLLVVLNNSFNPANTFVFKYLVNGDYGIWLVSGVKTTTVDEETTIVPSSIQETIKELYSTLIQRLKDLDTSTTSST